MFDFFCFGRVCLFILPRAAELIARGTGDELKNLEFSWALGNRRMDGAGNAPATDGRGGVLTTLRITDATPALAGLYK